MTRSLLTAVALLAGFMASPVQAMSPDAVGAAIAQRFDVKVLRIMPIERDGKDCFAVTVMNPGGNFNEAYRVTTLLVDAATGDLVPQAQPQGSAYEPAVNTGGIAIRRETFREH